MKYFLQVIWEIVQQIPRKFTKILHPPSSRSTATSTSTQIKPRVFKRKHKTFRSFLKEESLSRSVRRKSAEDRHKPKRKSRYSKLHRRKFSMTFQQDNSQEDHSKDAYTNEIELECSEIFEDKNGLQISVITPHGQQQSQNRINQSDQELLRLFCNNQMQTKKSEKSKEDLRQMEWWEIEIECGKMEFHKTIETAPKQEAIKQIKVITLIDLTEDQENPKVFHIPISLRY